MVISLAAWTAVTMVASAVASTVAGNVAVTWVLPAWRRRAVTTSEATQLSGAVDTPSMLPIALQASAANATGSLIVLNTTLNSTVTVCRVGGAPEPEPESAGSVGAAVVGAAVVSAAVVAGAVVVSGSVGAAVVSSAEPEPEPEVSLDRCLRPETEARRVATRRRRNML